MKKFLVIIIMSLNFFIPSQADDIKDFQIEEMSIGESLLDYFTEEKIMKSKNKRQYKLKKFYMVSMRDRRFKEYDIMKFHLKEKDKRYIIHSLSGQLNMSINQCLKKQKTVLNQIIKLFSNPKIDDLGKRSHPAYPNGYTYDTYITLKSGMFVVSCYDLDVDAFLISADTNEFNDFLNKTYQ